MNITQARGSVAVIVLLGALTAGAFVGVGMLSSAERSTANAAKPDLSGRERTGKASFYAKKFTGRTMADGTRMDPHSDNAASRTLPLGTTARVTNVETGQSANVTIKDRGPYVTGRIIDLSPASARAIGLDEQDGIATVMVAPIAVPLPDGGVKKGAAADLIGPPGATE